METLTLVDNPKVDAVARAIYEAGTFSNYCSESGLVKLKWNAIPESGKDTFRTLAKAAMNAMTQILADTYGEDTIDARSD